MSKPRPLPLELDFQSGLPAYAQIVRRIERLAAAGSLAPGAQLPTVRGLAAQLGLNFNTVARAYRLLHAAGLVTTQPGRGTFLLEGRSLPGPRQARRGLLEALTREYLAAAHKQRFSDREISAALSRSLGRG